MEKSARRLLMKKSSDTFVLSYIPKKEPVFV